MEFLMTYGWAIMVLLVAISAFAYFGIMNPQKTMPDKCIFTAGLNCRDQQIVVYTAAPDTMGVTVMIENKLGERIIIQEVNMTTSYAGATLHPVSNQECSIDGNDLENGAGVAQPQPVNADAVADMRCDISFGAARVPEAGNTQKVDVIIKYRKLTGSLTQTAQGEIQTTIQAS
jgi:uncharacterized protein (UPF0333 family)